MIHETESCPTPLLSEYAPYTSKVIERTIQPDHSHKPISRWLGNIFDISPRKNIPDKTIERHKRITSMLNQLLARPNLETKLTDFTTFVDYANEPANWFVTHHSAKQIRMHKNIPYASSAPSWLLQINTATGWEDVVDVIKSLGLNPIADRLVYLHQTIANNPDETALDLESLRKFALFIANQRQLPIPQISVSPDGFVHIEWQIAEHGILIMVFLPSDVVRYVAVYQPPKSECPQWNTRGTLPPEHVMDTVGLFIDMLTAS